jgi:hypothetical protein
VKQGEIELRGMNQERKYEILTKLGRTFCFDRGEIVDVILSTICERKNSISRSFSLEHDSLSGRMAAVEECGRGRCSMD